MRISWSDVTSQLEKFKYYNLSLSLSEQMYQVTAQLLKFFANPCKTFKAWVFTGLPSSRYTFSYWWVSLPLNENMWDLCTLESEVENVNL